MVASHLKKIVDENKQGYQQHKQEGGNKPESFFNVAEEFNNNNQELINDVGSDEFVAKNIRVRPQSGMTTNDKEEKSDIYGGKQSMLDQLGQSIIDEEEKFNRNAHMDLDEQRENVKKNKNKYEEDLVKKEEKIQKARNKRS